MDKIKGIISIFVLPNEIENFCRTLVELKRNSAYIDTNEINLKVDITLCVSDEMVDWENTQLPKDYIIDRVGELCRRYLDWCDYDLYNEYGNYVLGCVSHRRRSLFLNQDSDFFIWLDTDIFFKDTTLSYFIQSYKAVKQAGNTEFIITPQIVRQWDNTWDVLVNNNFKNNDFEYYKHANIFQDVLSINDTIKINKSPEFKFAGGWFTLISTPLLLNTEVPESFGHYGLEDTYIMHCCNIMKNKQQKVDQFILENLLVGEIRRNNVNETINKFVSIKNRKEEFLKVAESNFQKELLNFINK